MTPGEGASVSPDSVPARRRGSARGDLLLLLLFATVVLAAGIGFRDPWPADEPRYALVARDMVETGQWLFPHRAGELYSDKPPVFFWLMAAAYAATGSLRIGFLLPSLLAGLGTLALVWDLARRLWGRQVALFAGATLLVTVQFALQARTAQIDATLAFWTTLGLYGLVRHLVLGPAWRWWAIGWAAMGLGVITKGTGILPALLLVPWAWARSRGWEGVPRFRGGWRWAVGPLCLLGAIGLWLVPLLVIVARSGDPALEAYRNDLLWRQTAVRYGDSWGHINPPWYFLTNVIPGLWMPITLTLPWLAPAWWRRLKARDGRLLMLLGWIALVVFFFSLSAGKRGVYILPAVPALALATAPFVPELWARRGLHRLAFGLTLFLAAVLLVVGVAGAAIAPGEVARLAERYEADLLPVVLIAGVLALVAALVARPRRGLAGFAAFLLAAWPLMGWGVGPLMNPSRSGLDVMAPVAEALGPGEELATLEWKEQLVLQADRPMTHFGWRVGEEEGARLAAAWLAEADHRWVLMPREAMEPCFGGEGAIDLGVRHRRHWMLVRQPRSECAAAGRDLLAGGAPVFRSR